MIILDEDAQQQPKLTPFVAGPTLRLPDPVIGRPPSPLPDYETSQAQQQHLVRKPPAGPRADSRFCRATLWALAIYICITLILGVPFVAVKFSRRSHWHPSPQSFPWGEAAAEHTNSPDSIFISKGEGATTCSWTHSNSKTFTASVQHIVPPTGSFVIRSNVSHKSDHAKRLINGTFTVDINPNRTASDAVVSLFLQSSSLELQERTHVCFETANTTSKLFIHVPHNLSSHDFLNFTVALLLPFTATPLQIKKLVTYLPTFTQHITDLNQKVDFSQANIEGPLSHVLVDSMSGRKIHVKSSLAEIRGTFNVTESLTLDTIGAPIKANITLVHESRREAPTFLTLDTGNSAIETRIVLQAPPLSSLTLLKQRHPPPFLAHLKTFNAPLAASISTTRATLPLHLHVQNNMAPTSVTLDESYEGTFDVQTKLADAVVQESKLVGLTDEEGRERNYVYDHVSSTRTYGWVGYGKRPDAEKRSWDVGVPGTMRQGHVEVISSLSDVVLKLGE